MAYKNKSLSLPEQLEIPPSCLISMKIKILAIGKTDEKNLEVLIEKYMKRLTHYLSVSLETLPDIKNASKLSEKEQKRLEGESILKKIQSSDQVVLLDEKGKEFRSVEFSQYLQKKMNAGTRNLIFVIGGPYGFSDQVYHRANGKLSLSRMTLSHQMIRLFLVEQIYRGLTILRNEPYHHE